MFAVSITCDYSHVTKPSGFGVEFGYGNGIANGEYLTGVAPDDGFEGDDDSDYLEGSKSHAHRTH